MSRTPSPCPPARCAPRTAGARTSPPPDEPPAKPGRFYTVQQLKALVSFMELCGVQAIDLTVVDGFCKVMRFDIFDAMGATKEND